MRKLIVSALVTLDGVFSTPASWAGPYFDSDAAAHSMAKLQECDTMLMGRNTYEYFVPMWGAGGNPYSDQLGELRKYVFSSTLSTLSALSSLEWKNSTLVKDDVISFVTALKEEPGKDIMVYGYGRLGQTLVESGLVDELGLWINPVIVGNGTPLFRPGKTVPLQHVSTDTKPNGSVVLTYTKL